MHSVAVDNAKLVLFDYSSPSDWKLEQTIDLSSNYWRWYEELIGKMRVRQADLIARFGQQTFSDLLGWYQSLLQLIMDGSVGGAVVLAMKIDTV